MVNMTPMQDLNNRFLRELKTSRDTRTVYDACCMLFKKAWLKHDISRFLNLPLEEVEEARKKYDNEINEDTGIVIPSTIHSINTRTAPPPKVVHKEKKIHVHPDTIAILKEFDKGKSYSEIIKLLGVSKKQVYSTLDKYRPNRPKLTRMKQQRTKDILEAHSLGMTLSEIMKLTESTKKQVRNALHNNGLRANKSSSSSIKEIITTNIASSLNSVNITNEPVNTINESNEKERKRILNPFTEEERKIIKEKLANGDSLQQVAEYFGCTYAKVWNYVTNKEIDYTRAHRTREDYKNPAFIAELVKLYTEDKLTMKQIAKLKHCSRAKIGELLRKAGVVIAARTQDDAQYPLMAAKPMDREVVSESKKDGLFVRLIKKVF